MDWLIGPIRFAHTRAVLAAALLILAVVIGSAVVLQPGAPMSAPAPPPVAAQQSGDLQPSAPMSAPVPAPVAAQQSGDIWQPALVTSWQWQLEPRNQPADISFDVAMYDIDLFYNDASVVAAIHARRSKAVCYISVGALEDWRPDANRFPAEAVGKRYVGWRGERWLDIRRLDLVGPLLEARLDLCKAKGFDGVEPDNIDGYLNDTGFPLTYEDQLRFNIWIASAAHARGLSVALKNDLAQVNDLLPYFDWALLEECFEDGDCAKALPFIAAGKAVFHVEYDLDTGEFCPQANAMNFNSMKKNLQLDAERAPCR